MLTKRQLQAAWERARTYPAGHGFVMGEGELCTDNLLAVGALVAERPELLPLG